MSLHPYQKQMYQKVALGIALVVLPLAGFFAGTLYQKQTTAQAPASNPHQRMKGPEHMAHNRAFGKVVSIGDKSITITDQVREQEETYTLTTETSYQNGKASDIKAGDMVVLVLDSSNHSQVTSVTINPGTKFLTPSAGE